MKIEVFVETVDHNDDPVSVAAISLLYRWCRITRDSAFCQRYEAISESREARRHIDRLRL